MQPKITYTVAALDADGYEYYVLAYDGSLLVGIADCLLTTPAEISGVVSPSYRRQGIFSHMFQLLLKKIPGKDYVLSTSAAVLDIPVSSLQNDLSALKLASDQFPVSEAALSLCAKALGVPYRYHEYLMQYSFINASDDLAGKPSTVLPVTPHPAVSLEWEEQEQTCYFYDDARTDDWKDTAIGHISVAVTKNHINLYDVSVEPALRNQGYGTAILLCLLSQYRSGLLFQKTEDAPLDIFCQEMSTPLILQVSERNKAAYRLYLACGFQVIDSVAYYSKFV